MRKIVINLCPDGGKRENKILLSAQKYASFALLLLILCIGINVIFFVLGVFLQFPYRKLSARWQQLTPQVNSMLSLREEVQALTKEREEYKTLFQESISLSRVFAEVYESLPKNIWFETIKFKDDTIEFIGYVVKWKEDYFDSLSKFIKNLKNKTYFSTTFKKINLKNSRKGRIASREVLKFEIECKK